MADRNDSSKDKKDQLLDHESDGIQEYDNDLPRWWLNLFYGTIIWAGIYVIYFHFSGRPLPKEELAASLAERPVVTHSSPEDHDWAKLKTDSAVLNKGKEVFKGKCAACHLEDGGGLVGPNLTDNYWIHGGKPEQIFKTIVEGVPDKGMLSWKTLMPESEIVAVTTHILTLKGTTPKTPKAPQGNAESN